MKYTKSDLKEMKEHFKDEYNKILEARIRGKTGYIGFQDYD